MNITTNTMMCKGELIVMVNGDENRAPDRDLPARRQLKTKSKWIGRRTDWYVNGLDLGPVSADADTTAGGRGRAATSSTAGTSLRTIN